MAIYAPAELRKNYGQLYDQLTISRQRAMTFQSREEEKAAAYPTRRSEVAQLRRELEQKNERPQFFGQLVQSVLAQWA